MKTHKEVQEALYELNGRYRRLEERLALSKKQERSVIQENCGKIGHDPKWRQIAGDGAYCGICGVDLDIDD